MNTLYKQITSLILILSLFSAANLSAQNTESVKSDTTDIFNKIYLERITVVGAPVWQTRIPGAASYIGSETLQQQRYDDINRILRNISGINIQEEDGYGLRPNIGIRGAGVERSTKVNIMEDGVLIAPAPYSAPAAYYFPTVSRMSAVEVRKGSAQIKYGPNTTGGAINLISTPIPSQLNGNAEIAIGERNANKLYANFGDSKKNYGYLFEGLNLATDGFKELDGGGSTGFNIRDFMGKFMVRTNPDVKVYQRFELKAGYHDEVSDETYLGLTRDDFNANPFRRYAASQLDQITTEHLQFTARHFAQVSQDLDLTTTLYRNNFKRNWYKLQTVNGTGPAGVVRNPQNNPDAMDILRGTTSADDALKIRANNREYYSQGIESKLTYRFSTGNINNNITLGVRYHYDEEDRFQLEDSFRMENGVMILTTPGVPGSQANRVGSATALSLYLQDEISFRNFIFTPGFRYESIDFKDQNYGGSDLNRTGTNSSVNEYTINEFIPGIGIIYSVNDNLALISGVHKGFSPPSPGSSPDTRSERSVNYEFGSRYATDHFKAEVIGFYNNYTNLLGSDLAAGGGSGTTAQFNAGEVVVFGIETSVSANLNQLFKASFGIPVSINYTFTDATFQNSFDSNFGPWGNVEKGDKLPFIPEHQMNANIGLKFSKLDLNVSANSVASMRTTAGSGTIDPESGTDSYFLIDLSSDYMLTDNFNLFVNLRNLFDHTYIVSDRPHGLRPGLPRTFMGGVKVTL